MLNKRENTNFDFKCASRQVSDAFTTTFTTTKTTTIQLQLQQQLQQLKV